MIGGDGDEVSMISVVKQYRLGSVLYFGFFSSFCSYYRPSNYSLFVSLLDHYKFKGI